MALVVCLQHSNEGWHPLPPDIEEYMGWVDPVGYDDTAAICYVEGCQNPGLIFLKQPEIDAIVNDHQRLFTGEAGFVKVKLAVAGEVQKARLAGR